ncbi:MAG: STAS domain-containing protein [Pyrinomonadaceae bacterium]
MLNITEHQTENATILKLEGNIIMGGGSKKLGQEVRRLIEKGKTNIVLNFSGIKYLDSSGVGELIALSQTIDEVDGNLMLSDLSEKVEDVLTLSSVLPLFEIYDDDDDALNSLTSAT